MVNVFTCGVFDILHWGHVSFLQRARKFGDTLTVAVNCDEYVRRKKGRDPVFHLVHRMAVLEALACVDRVVSFSEDDPCEIIKQLKPQIVVKGSEYSAANAPEAALIESMGGRFVVLPSEPIHVADILEKLEATQCE